ncbi:hypothetical protein ACN6LF_001896 [[Kitasatospora] papulosa]|uniref:hypothetical protein n=1 Tax=Streptomyces TaxID=1883 RepID=UPI0029A542AF|nr:MULTISPECIES: hypothetical protein [unclassified Streptomyces]MDX3183461.1 hypothetical protein [Streptomyces sp. ME02-7008A-1]MDX3303913.1 hypothetical protein [Streptomyces sp. ME02-7008A]
MPTPSAHPLRVRTLADLNAEIRALVEGGLGSLEGRQEYERLLVEWGYAVQDGVVEAA